MFLHDNFTSLTVAKKLFRSTYDKEPPIPLQNDVDPNSTFANISRLGFKHTSMDEVKIFQKQDDWYVFLHIQLRLLRWLYPSIRPAKSSDIAEGSIVELVIKFKSEEFPDVLTLAPELMTITILGSI